MDVLKTVTKTFRISPVVEQKLLFIQTYFNLNITDTLTILIETKYHEIKLLNKTKIPQKGKNKDLDKKTNNP